MNLNGAIPQPVDTYLGIPFAQPPVGELRFRPPQPITTKWSEPLQAKTQAPYCLCAMGGQEDCLYLNVFAPSTPSATPRAVMIWIFGGGFTSGNIATYNATALAATEDVIVVMGNYRLGLLGFLSSDWSMEESGSTGNWGLLDQRAVFQWVQTNIAAFGGDPSKVTVFGESAGAMSLLAHMVSEESTGLFQSAIVQSGTTDVELFFQPRADAQKFNEWFAKTHLNCPGGLKDSACIRSVPASRFLIAMTERDGWSAPTWSNPMFPLFAASPVIDGSFLKDSPHRLLQQGKLMSGLTSVIIGTTEDEGSVFATQLPRVVRPHIEFPPLQSELFQTFKYIVNGGDAQIAQALEEDFPKFQAYYGAKPVDPKRPAFRDAEFEFVSNMARNIMFACPTVTFAELLVNHGVPTYVYNFDFNFWPQEAENFPVGKFLEELGNMTVENLGAFHSSDVPFALKMFVNRNITVNDLSIETPYAMYMGPAYTKPGDAKHIVSDYMSCTWANTAKCGTPDCAPCGTVWERYTVSGKKFPYFHPDGNTTMEAVRPTGALELGDSFPSVEKCNWFMQLGIPFHDLRADLNLAGNPSSERIDMDHSGVVQSSALTVVFMVAAMMAM